MPLMNICLPEEFSALQPETEAGGDWSVYLVLCQNGSLYCGVSNRPAERFAAHLAGRGARYTRMHKPLEMYGKARQRRTGLNLIHYKKPFMNKPLRILGIDPGSRITGFGIIDVVGREHFYVASGCIKTIPGDELAGRIGIIVENIGEIITCYKPQQAAVEQVFVNVNPAATLMLGQARGAAVAALVMRGLPVYEYTALQVKQAVVGQGKAAKEQVQDMVVRMLGLSGTPQADAADGLAVALTHALRNQGLAARLNPDGLQVKRGRFQ